MSAQAQPVTPAPTIATSARPDAPRGTGADHGSSSQYGVIGRSYCAPPPRPRRRLPQARAARAPRRARPPEPGGSAELIRSACPRLHRGEHGARRCVVGHRDADHRRLEVERLEHVRRARRRRRTDAEQRVRSRAERRRDLPRHREHLPPVLEREVRGDQRARALAGLDDDRRAREPRDDPIPSREAPRGRLDTGLVLRYDEPAAGHDRAGELGVRCRVVAVDAAAEHGDRRPVRSKGSTMGLAVDPSCEPAHHGRARRGRVCGEEPRDRAAVARAGARADDRDRGAA